MAQQDPSKKRTQIEKRSHNRALFCIKPDATSVIGQGEEQDGIAQLAHTAPSQHQPDFSAFEKPVVESRLIGHLCLIAITDQDDGHEIGHELTSSEHTKRQRRSGVLQQRTRCQAVNQPPEPGPGRADTIGKTPSAREPLRNDIGRADVQKPRVPADADPLAEIQMPDFGGEGSADQRRGKQDQTNGESGTGPQLPGAGVDRRGDDKGHGHGEATDEGVVERAGVGVEAFGEEVVEEDAVCLVMSDQQDE